MNKLDHPGADKSLSPAAQWGLLLLPLLIAGTIGWLRWPASEPDSIDVTSHGPQFATFADIVAASDLIIIGTIEAAEAGRTISDATNPNAGINTTLYRIAVEQTLVGDSSTHLTVEHETALADGTPISINGTRAPTVGEQSLLFLIDGETEAFPFYAIINEQGRYLLAGDRITALSTSDLALAIGDTSLNTLTARLLGLSR